MIDIAVGVLIALMARDVLRFGARTGIRALDEWQMRRDLRTRHFSHSSVGTRRWTAALRRMVAA